MRDKGQDFDEHELEEQQEAVAIRRDLIDNINDIVQSVRPDGSFLYTNRAWRETLGYSLEEIPDLSLFRIIHPDSMAHCMKMFPRVLAGEKLDHVEVAFVTKDGRTILMDGSINCRFENDKPVATRGVFRDVTERKRMEQALRQANMELQAALTEVKLLEGILPICGFCKKIRDKDNRWHPLESYISSHSEAHFSHTFCPNCGTEHYGKHYGEKSGA